MNTMRVNSTSTRWNIDVDDGPLLTGDPTGTVRTFLVDTLEITLTEDSTADGRTTRKVNLRARGYATRKDGTPGKQYTMRYVTDPTQKRALLQLAERALGLDLTERS